MLKYTCSKNQWQSLLHRKCIEYSRKEEVDYYNLLLCTGTNHLGHNLCVDLFFSFVPLEGLFTNDAVIQQDYYLPSILGASQRGRWLLMLLLHHQTNISEATVASLVFAAVRQATNTQKIPVCATLSHTLNILIKCKTDRASRHIWKLYTHTLWKSGNTW